MFLAGKVPWYVVSVLVFWMRRREHTTSYDSHADGHGAIGVLDWLKIVYIVRNGLV